MLLSQEEEISRLLLEYASGNFTAKGRISDRFDETDAIIQGINMLGEELEATNVSKNYFSSIYNAVTDLIIISDDSLTITDVNTSFRKTFNTQVGDLLGKSISGLIDISEINFSKLDNTEGESPDSITLLRNIKYNNITIIGQISISKLIDRSNKSNGYLIKIIDVTESKKTEQIIIQTIVRTEQNEQKRMADDLHDSIAQEIAMAKLIISNLELFKNKDPNYIKLVETAKSILDDSVVHIREICYNLMPSALIKGNVNDALIELTAKLNSQNLIKFSYSSKGNFNKLNSELEIVIFRITQEFLNNSMKHSQAKNVTICAKINDKDEFSLNLADNGIGFNKEKLKQNMSARGINNLITKVEAYDGTYILKSTVKEGTTLEITFPKIRANEQA